VPVSISPSTLRITRVLPANQIHKNQGRFVTLNVQGKSVSSTTTTRSCFKSSNAIWTSNQSPGKWQSRYIAKYISKSESPILRQEIQDAIDKINKAENLPAQKKMHRIAMTLLRNREVSSQEAAFRVCHLFLRKSTRATVFLQPTQTRPLQNANEGEPE